MSNPNDTQRLSPTRRHFLKRGAAVIGTASLAGSLGSRAYAAENNTIKLALVGCGGRGTGAVNNAFATTGGPVKLHAMADLFEHRLSRSHAGLSKRHADKVDVPPERQFLGFDAYRKAIDTLSRGDVVLLTTHAAFRPMMFEYAVSRGVNVFAEKSFATDSPNVRRWFAAARESQAKNLKVGVGFMWRHSRSRQEAIKRIQDGEIGDVQSLRIYRVHGPVHCPKRPADKNEIEFQIQHATCFNWVSSGFYIDWHCHNIDVACWAKGAWPVTAQGFGGRCNPKAGEQFDHYTVEYTFPDGTKLYAFSRHMHNCWNTYSDYAHGTRGSAILMTSLSQPRSRIYKSQKMADDQLVWDFGNRDPNPYVVEWQVLLDAIRNDKPHNEAYRAGEAEVAALMGRAATHTGKMVTWDQVTKSNFTYVKDIDNLTFASPSPIKEAADGYYAPPMPGVSVEL